MSVRATGPEYRASGRIAALAFLTVAALLAPAGSASAQNLFETLFGRRLQGPPSASAFADPFAAWNPFGWRAPEVARSDVAGIVSYCVRLCDGRYFPIERNGGSSPAEACSSFCPASRTRIYSGSSIDGAVATDGRAYRELGTAFLYREKIVPGCTCNGRNGFGLMNPRIADDPTLRPGDIVATNAGLMAFNGNAGSRRQAPSFTPIASYPGLPTELRRRLAETKIEPLPRDSVSLGPPTGSPGESKAAARSSRQKQAQSER
ncbi:MAG TPA: DUF2865 domain-containing protein [Xanthobacteraceae bacterium]|jgi:hypothetical protein